MSVHDHLWKSLLKAFLPELLELVLPEVLESYHADRPAFLEQEAFSEAMGGNYSRMDLVAQLEARQGPPGLLLVLVEVERRFGLAMDARILSYFRHLRIKHHLPVVPIVLFLQGGPEGVVRRRVVEEVLGHQVSVFNYWAFGLSRAAAEDYLGRNNLTPALAACMGSKRWRPAEKKLECLLSILESPVDGYRKFLLVNAVETYVDLAGEEVMDYAELVKMSTRGQEVKKMEMTWADKIEHRAKSRYLEKGRSEGLEKGRSEGLEKGRNEGFKMSLRLMLEARFGHLDGVILRRFDAIDDLGELESLSKRILGAESLADLDLTP